MNAYRHGLTGQIDVRTPEEQGSARPILRHDHTKPRANRRRRASVRAVHCRGSLAPEQRARTLENNIFTLACSFNDSTGETESPEIDRALADARTFVADPERFQLLTIYERRIHSNMTKNMKQLIELQAIRRTLEAAEKAEAKAQRAQALDEARLHTQLAEMEGVTCDVATDFPDLNGFVFSTDEIAQAIRSTRHLKAAKHAEVSNWATPHSARPHPPGRHEGSHVAANV